ncbi:MAG: phenylalanine--tRNA ligase subunit beta [Myxococcota bacterium]
MRIARDVLERFTELPADNRELRLLLDDLGLEVKRVEDLDGPLTFTLELLANRGDHHCYEGVAREIVGRTGLGLRTVATTPLDLSVGNWPVERHTPLVLTYTATVLVRDGEAGTLSAEDLRTLEAAGIHSISAPVDATNLANLEIGQPTHVFDADKVDGPIILRESVAGERAWPLFSEEHVELPAGTLVVADRSKILAVAGVIGCEDSKATEATTRLVVESATFDPVSVRKASRALSIHTDSSARFERGADPEKAVLGAGRVVHLLEGAGWRRDGGTSRVGIWEDPVRVIEITAAGTNGFLETALSAEAIAEILERYGFGVAFEGETLRVRVPSWRLWDVAFPADLYEEVAKSVGYNATPVSLPPVDLGALPGAAETRRQAVDEVLVGNGFYEVFTDGFYGSWAVEGLGVDELHPLASHVTTRNSLERSYSLLKNNCLAQAVSAVATNAHRRTDDVKLFEWTRTFHPVEAPEGDKTRSPSKERAVLWAIASGRAFPGSWSDKSLVDALFLKGVVQELAVELGLDLALDVPSTSDPLHDCLHPGRQASITLDGARVGILGEVHPAVLKNFKIKRGRPVYLEIRADALLAEGSPPVFIEPDSTQPIERHLTFSLPPRVEAQSIAAVIDAFGPEWLTHVHIVDRFDHLTVPAGPDGSGEPRRAITFELTFSPGSSGQSRSADEVNGALEQLVAEVERQYGSAGVVQR